MANGTYKLGDKLAFSYPKNEGGQIKWSPRTGFVVPPVKSQLNANVVFVETPEGTRSFSLNKMKEVQVLS